MKQRNSVYSYFNQVTEIYKIYNSLIYKFKTNNCNFYVPTKLTKIFDYYNYHCSYYLVVLQTHKNITLRFFLNFFLIKWASLAFKGKSFRMRNFKNNNKMTLNFGYSHWTRFKLYEMWSFFKRRRQRYIIFTYNRKNFEYFKRFFPYIRLMNRYTLRGLRLRRQTICRRFGKISQHVSILH